MINHEWQLSRGMRLTLGLGLWACVATFAVYQYRTAAKQTELQLSSESARSEGLEAIMSDDHYGVITVDRAGKITDFNPGAERLTGISEADAMGHHVGEVVCGELVEKLGQAFRDRDASEGVAKVLVVNCDMVGSAVKVRCRIYAARSKKSGELLGVVLVDPRANVKVEAE